MVQYNGAFNVQNYMAWFLLVFGSTNLPKSESVTCPAVTFVGGYPPVNDHIVGGSKFQPCFIGNTSTHSGAPFSSQLC